VLERIAEHMATLRLFATGSNALGLVSGARPYTVSGGDVDMAVGHHGQGVLRSVPGRVRPIARSLSTTSWRDCWHRIAGPNPPLPLSVPFALLSSTQTMAPPEGEAEIWGVGFG